jgi:hypothetical protein
MTPMEIYLASDGDATKALYTALEAKGPIGIVALNLFRAQKCSERAKGYRRRAHKSEAYERKQWSMNNLCLALFEHSVKLGIGWGWKLDPEQSFHAWVLYVDLPTGQVSFHTADRGKGPDYLGDWDKVPNMSAQRVVSFVTSIHSNPVPEPVPVRAIPFVASSGVVPAEQYDAALNAWKLKHGYANTTADASDNGIFEQVAADRQRKGDSYCVLCSKGPQPISGMRLITRAEDPYMQFDNDPADDDKEENRVRACPECFKEKYEHD